MEQDEEERKRYKDHKWCQNFQNDGSSRRCFNYKEVGHLKRDCPKLRTGVNEVSMIGYGGRNARPGGNENRSGNPGNMSGSGNK